MSRIRLTINKSLFPKLISYRPTASMPSSITYMPVVVNNILLCAGCARNVVFTGIYVIGGICLDIDTHTEANPIFLTICRSCETGVTFISEMAHAVASENASKLTESIRDMSMVFCDSPCLNVSPIQRRIMVVNRNTVMTMLRFRCAIWTANSDGSLHHATCFL